MDIGGFHPQSTYLGTYSIQLQSVSSARPGPALERTTTRNVERHT